jgi:hypothetical protein
MNSIHDASTVLATADGRVVTTAVATKPTANTALR